MDIEVKKKIRHIQVAFMSEYNLQILIKSGSGSFK